MTALQRNKTKSPAEDDEIIIIITLAIEVVFLVQFVYLFV